MSQVPTNPIECPYCGAPITTPDETKCPFCGEVLARPVPPGANAGRSPMATVRIVLASLGVPLLCCCWPIGALLIGFGAPWPRRVRIAIVVVSAFLWVLYIVSQFQSGACHSTNGGFDCNGASPSPSGIPDAR